MFPRALSQTVSKLSTQYPVLTIMGPRQSGKTTLVRTVFPKKAYVNLELPDIRLAAQSDPRYFLSQFPDGVILDEIQRIPELLSYIQVEVDNHRTMGQYILTGSYQLMLHQAISQSLAGRTTLLTLLPLSLSELAYASNIQDVDMLLHQGFYPRIYMDGVEPVHMYRDYVQTYIEKDVREIQHIKDLSMFQKFMHLCAGRIGQVLNKGSLSTDLGISDHSVESWLSLLEASYVIVRLRPYFENFGKRVIKSPKLYFTDVGLATYLLGIEDPKQLARDPMRGFLFENMVILELMKTRLNQGRDPNLYYYRDHHQNEVDVIYKTGNTLIPIEIKVSQTFNSQFLKNVYHYQKTAGSDRVPHGYVVYSGEYEQKIHDFEVLRFTHTDRIILMDSH